MKKYIENKYYMNDFLDVQIYPGFRKAEKGKRKAKTKVTDDVQKRLNAENASKYMDRLVHKNFTQRDYTLDLTYAVAPSSDKEALRNIANYIRRVRKLYDFGGDNYNLMIMRCAKKAITIIQKVNGAFEYCCICRDNGNGYFIDDGAVWWETTDSFHTLTVEQNGNEIIFNYNASYISTKEPYFDLWVLSENKVS